MKKDPFMPRPDEGKSKWMDNFSAKLPFYAGKYNITPEEVAQTQQDALVFAGILNYRDQLDAYVTAMTGLKNIARDGTKDNTTLQVPMPPTPMFSGSVIPGIFVLWRLLTASNHTSITILPMEVNWGWKEWHQV
jgi:hypothetical protein